MEHLKKKKHKVAMIVFEISTILNSKYFASSVRKRTRADLVILYVKNDLKFFKTLINTRFLDTPPQK